MAEWIEVPAHRIYVILARELRDDVDFFRENGRHAMLGEIPYRFVRKKNGKVFKLARFALQCSGVQDCTALEDVASFCQAVYTHKERPQKPAVRGGIPPLTSLTYSGSPNPS